MVEGSNIKVIVQSGVKMEKIIKKGHVSNYPNPISFDEGESLLIGELDTEFPNWIRVQTIDGNEGWAPTQYIDLESSTAIQDYSAYELNVNIGDCVNVLFELNEWSMIESTIGKQGWIPNNCT